MDQARTSEEAMGVLGGMARRMLSLGSLIFVACSLGFAISAAGVPLGMTPPTVSFHALPSGWHSYRSEGAVATSWAYGPGTSSGGWADHMPPGGIAVSVFFPTAKTRFPLLKLVLPHRPATLLDGTTDTPEYRIEGRVHSTNVFVFVDIRRKQPTVSDLRHAQRVVSSIRFTGFRASSAGVWHDGKAGLTIGYPAGWHVTTRSLTTITQPAQRLVVYSGSAPRSLVDAVSPRANQALAIVMEQTSVSASDLKQFPPRPKKFMVSHLGGIESFEGNRWAERVFRDHRRAFYAFIWVGADDTRQLPTLLNALDSLRVT
jgi:hypothetical protein